MPQECPKKPFRMPQGAASTATATASVVVVVVDVLADAVLTRNLFGSSALRGAARAAHGRAWRFLRGGRV